MSANKRNRIKLTEEDLRNFVSYSVARLLREAYDFPGKEIMLSNGESDGFERSEYGSSDVEVKFTDWMDEAYSDAKRLILKVNEENGGKFSEILSKENSPEESFYECIMGLPEDAFVVCLDFTYEQGMKGDGYLQPDDEDSLTINKKELKQPNANDAVRSIQDPTVKELVVAVINEWVDWVDEDYIKEHVMGNSLFEERNLGVTFHSNGEDAYEPENPYGDMTWDEYVKAKANEKDQSKQPSEDEPSKNLGITAHFDGKKPEKTPEEMEDEKHMFDDNYWVGKMNLSKEDLAEMVNKSVRLIAERINLNEISKGLLDRAREAAHKDMMRNFGDSKIRNKRDRQWKKFGDEYGRMGQEEKDSICPHVAEADLVNMPEDTYVIMNGDGRDAVTADFRTSYSGRAGTREQCEEYVKKFYDTSANWEYLPEIVPLKEYLNNKRSR